MPTNLAINDRLLNKALRVSALKTKKEAVTLALKEFIERREQKKILKAFGSVKFRKGWNYKKDRWQREHRH
jgi:Arc/MetJ family transcription regulator